MTKSDNFALAGSAEVTLAGKVKVLEFIGSWSQVFAHLPIILDKTGHWNRGEFEAFNSSEFYWKSNKLDPSKGLQVKKLLFEFNNYVCGQEEGKGSVESSQRSPDKG